MEEEIWKDIPDYKGYQVSNLGRIRTYNKITSNKRYGERHWANRILKQKIQVSKNGRKDCRVELWNKKGHKTFLVARLVAFTFYDIDLNSRLTVDHLDGDSINNKLTNLELTSLKENIRRAFENGLISSSVKIKIIDKETNEEKQFSSMTKAGQYIGHNHGYISAKIKKGEWENKKYKWEIIK